MTSRERVHKTLNFESVDRVPRDLWTLPFLKADITTLTDKYPMDLGSPDVKYGESKRAKGVPYAKGIYVDAWGSEWHAYEHGVTGEVRNAPIFDWCGLDSYMPPFELLDNADFSMVNESCAKSDLFIKAGTETRPYERLQFLRGTENLLMDLAYGDARIFKLIEMIHDFSIREMEMWAKTDVDAIMFMDDWGSQNSLLISPAMWREIFKPLYTDYCNIIKGSGKKVFFHSDGNISSIYPDLIEIGIDAVNSQLFCMDIEDLANKYNGKITFWGEIDRQTIIPFGTEDDTRNAVRRVRNAMDKNAGGVIAQCEWGHDAKPENILALYDEWSK